METQKRNRRWRQYLLLFALLLATGGLLFWQSEDRPLAFDTTQFVATTLPTAVLPPSATLWNQVAWKWMELRDRFTSKTKRAANYTFSASAPVRCSVHGLLNQCMEVSGTRYVIWKDVAAGTVEFGHTNALNGNQWVAAFEEALKNGKVEWYDFKTKEFRRENLALTRYDHKTVVVVPQSQVDKYRP